MSRIFWSDIIPVAYTRICFEKPHFFPHLETWSLKREKVLLGDRFIYIFMYRVYRMKGREMGRETFLCDPVVEIAAFQYSQSNSGLSRQVLLYIYQVPTHLLFNIYPLYTVITINSVQHYYTSQPLCFFQFPLPAQMCRVPPRAPAGLLTTTAALSCT